MFNLKNSYVYALFIVLVMYTAYTFLWTRFGLGVTSILQYVLLGLVCIGAFFYLIKASKYKNSWTNWLFLVWITQLLSFFIAKSDATTQFKELTFVLLVAAPIVSNVYNPQYAKRFFIVMSIVSVAMYFVTINMMHLQDENSYGGGYMVLVAMPVLLYFFRNKSASIQILITIILFVLVLTSMKRGDILSCVLGILAYYYFKLKEFGKFNYRIVLSLVVTAIVVFFAFQHLLETNDIFAWRFQQTLDGDSSARDSIYSNLWYHFLDAPLNVQLFGGGFDATLKIGGVRAHSDLLEVLSCEGLFGLLIYLSGFFSLFRHMLRRKDTTEKAILAFVLAIWTVKMFFSMFIFSQPTIILFALTAYILNKNIDKRYEY